MPPTFRPPPQSEDAIRSGLEMAAKQKPSLTPRVSPKFTFTDGSKLPPTTSYFHQVRTLMSKKPLLSRTALTFGIFSLADYTAQQLEDREFKLFRNPERTLRYAFSGAICLAPLFHAWYGFIDPRLPGRKFWYVKLGLECVSIGPLYLASLIGFYGLLDTLDPKQAWAKVCSDWWPLYKDALHVVPFYQAINYVFIAPQLRFLFLGSCQFIWNTYIAYFVSDAELHIGEEEKHPTEISEILSDGLMDEKTTSQIDRLARTQARYEIEKRAALTDNVEHEAENETDFLGRLPRPLGASSRVLSVLKEKDRKW